MQLKQYIFIYLFLFFFKVKKENEEKAKKLAADKKAAEEKVHNKL